MDRDRYDLVELARRLENLIRYGEIYEVDHASARARVQAGKLITAWLPWIASRSAGDKNWWAPEIGERVLILSPSGTPSLGIVMPALYSTDTPAPADSPDVHLVEYADGTRLEYNRANHRLVADVAGDVEITAKGTVRVQAEGNLEMKARGRMLFQASEIDWEA